MGLPPQFKPDVPQANIVLGDEEGIADVDNPILVNINPLELLAPRIFRLFFQSHDLLEHEECVSLVNPPIPVGIPEENRSDLDITRLREGRGVVYRERDGMIAGDGIGVGRVLLRRSIPIAEGPGPGGRRPG